MREKDSQEQAQFIRTVRRALSSVLLAGALVGMNGCSDSGNEEAQVKSEAFNPEDTEFLHVPTEDRERMVITLNDWLKRHPQKRLVALSAIPHHDSKVKGFELITEPGDNSDQVCELLNFSVSSADEGNGPGAFGAARLQEWIDENADRRLIGLASIPHYGGGVNGYVVCSEAPGV